jgi:uncharacterized protein (TIGR02266 family)
MPRDDDKKTEANKPQRAHPRVDFFNPVKVVVPDDNTAVDVFAGNVSKGGMFLRSNRPLPKGKKVSLEFETKQGKVEVAEGEVVWNKEFEPISIDGAPAGMGVEFKSMTDDSRLKIEAFIDDALHVKPPQTEPPAPPPQQKPQAQQPAPEAPKPEPQAPKPEPQAPAEEPLRMKLEVASAAPPKEQKAKAAEAPPSPGGKAIMATTPPPRRTKMMLFGGFVLLVALVTFLTLLLIKPPGEGGETEKAAPAEPPAVEDKQPLPGEEKSAPVKAPEKPKTDPKAAVKAPEPKREPEKAPEPKKEPEKAPEPKKEPEKSAETKPPPETIAGLSVGLPVFSEKNGEWRMVLAASGPVEVKHFTLKDPPRLAVDFKGAVYSGKQRTHESPAPPVARVRVGEQPEFTRFVLDFEGSEVPRHRIVKKEDRVVVIFGR